MEDPVFSIKGKVILVTGAFGLFGQVLSKSFLQRGAKVVLAAHTGGKVINNDYEIDPLIDRNSYMLADLEITDQASVERCVAKTVERFGRIDVLINNASIDSKYDKDNISKIHSSRFDNYPFELIERSVNVNLLGTIRITQAVCRQMVEQCSGNIINVGSIYSLVAPNPKLYEYGEGLPKYKPVDYVVSKSFVPNFTRYLATYYAGYNIRCNAIAPHGVFDNHDDEFVKSFASISPLGRMCKTDELEGPFLFLASEASSYMTGVTLVLDGGWASV
jgi:NAD(P)-dependent dehydrogenase (short-subunit alcohol dehydrogenase family)